MLLLHTYLADNKLSFFVYTAQVEATAWSAIGRAQWAESADHQARARSCPAARALTCRIVRIRIRMNPPSRSESCGVEMDPILDIFKLF